MENSAKKRKRTKNTSYEQYEIYINELEGDFIFRSGTINPTVSDDYLEQRWEELVTKLNSIGDGPVLSAKEWKKRFDDWKYATRGKYRKIQEHRQTTGSGPATTLKITELEERALKAWGLSAVTGAEGVTIYEGIPGLEDDFTIIASHPIQSTSTILEELDVSTIENNLRTEVTNTIKENQSTSNELQNNIQTQSKSTQRSKITTQRPKPLSVICESLINSTQENNMNVNAFNTGLINFCNNYNINEREKLKFEIAKFKYLHPDFQFEAIFENQ